MISAPNTPWTVSLPEPVVMVLASTVPLTARVRVVVQDYFGFIALF
jgi:hypothetical protein